MGPRFLESEKYSRELYVAVRVVQMACSLCQKVQEHLISKSNDQVKSKDDDSPVTVAGNWIFSFFILAVNFFIFYFFWWVLFYSHV